MKTGRTALIIVIALLPILLTSGIGFAQTKGGKETIFFSGIVKDVSWDHKSIIVNDRSFFISQDTKIIDQTGKRLRIEDIKKDFEVGIDAIKHSSGFLIKEIVVITNRGV